jgi:hypothetical protein
LEIARSSVFRRSIVFDHKKTVTVNGKVKAA